MKVDLRDFIVNNKDQIMESLLENEDFEQVLQFDKKKNDDNFYFVYYNSIMIFIIHVHNYLLLLQKFLDIS